MIRLQIEKINSGHENGKKERMKHGMVHIKKYFTIRTHMDGGLSSFEACLM